ncbi:VWA domain-containing protein [Arthrobacter sp. CAN_A214]|uniref:VWA domain-containing protein n=1 Tax=Arthrobacter sp. CAN_A214 TaxID=2787720 RepID=UPI0018CBDEBE
MARSVMRSASIGFALVVATAAQLIGPAGPAQATNTLASEIAAVAHESFSFNSKGTKESLVASLTPVATAAPGPARIEDVAGTAAGYIDGVRYREDFDGQQAYLYDLHLLSHLDGAARKATDPAEAEVLSSALTDLLLAGRLTAETAVGDARTALTTPPAEAAGAAVDQLARASAERNLAAAEKSLSQARDALAKAFPAAAETHFAKAWRDGTNALADLGITFAGDRDSDGIPDRAELSVGGSPLLLDTDGDGLSDAFEFNAMAVLALNNTDTDADGVPDAAQDHDGDGLTAAQEQTAKTSPVDPDTDADGLTDDVEPSYGTDALAADTDGDTLPDGAEARGGTDPTNPDTDSDGVFDVDELLSVSVEGPGGASAVVTGANQSALGARIAIVADADSRTGADARLGAAFEFESPGEGMAKAEITLPYDTAGVQLGQAAERARVFWLDESANAWVPVAGDQRVDAAAGTVTVAVSHFSTYAVFDIVNWNETWTAKDNPCRTRTDGGGDDVVFLDLALSIDSSGSMSWNDPQGLRKDAAKNFVDALLPEDRAAVIDFDSFARVLQPLTTNKDAVKGAIDRIDDFGGTSISAGVSAANNVLANNKDAERGRVMILLTDGDGTWNNFHLTQAKQNLITIYTIGLGSAVNSGLLNTIATETGGKYHQVDDAAELPEVFRRISNDTGGDEGVMSDSDKDGLNDCVEIQGAHSPGTGLRYVSDPFDADTDGDGLADGQEVLPLGTSIGVPTASDTFQVLSDPSNTDTDGDSLPDPAELDEETSIWRADSDGDGLSDSDELSWATDPLTGDTDGDGYTDGTEVADTDAGFSPVVFDDPMSPDEWASEYAKGAALGDAGDGTTVPYLLGTISSSAVSFIPVVGWIAGAILDLRDAIANTVKTDWVAAGMSLAGIVPYVGDTANIIAKVTKFLGRSAHLLDDVVAAIAKLEDFPAKARADIIAGINSNWDALRKASPDMDEASFLRLASSRQGADHIVAALNRSKVQVGTPLPFVTHWREAETAVAGLFGVANTPLSRQVFRTPPGFSTGRVADLVDGSIMREVKSGFVPYRSRIRTQILKDAAILGDKVDNADIKDVVWHFVGGRTGSLGADPRILDLLEEHGIQYVIHLP